MKKKKNLTDILVEIEMASVSVSECDREDERETLCVGEKEDGNER